MKDDFSELNNEDRIKAEYDFLKMKLMLERGATFYEEKGDLPRDLEHHFLTHVPALEKQIDEQKTIRLIEKLGNPVHFKPTNETPESEFEKAWKELSGYMQEYGVFVDVYTPNISAKELYRFSIEELFNEEILDLNLPGLMLHFIYDDFHPNQSLKS